MSDSDFSHVKPVEGFVPTVTIKESQAKEETLNTYMGFPAQHEAVVQSLKECFSEGRDEDGLYPLVVLVGPMRVGKTTAVKRAADLPDDAPLSSEFVISGRPMLKVGSSSMEEVKALGPEAYEGKIIAFHEEGGERLLLIAEREREDGLDGMQQLVADLNELRKHAPVYFDISHSSLVMFPTDYTPDEAHIQEIAERKLNTRNKQLQALADAGGKMVALDRDPMALFNALAEFAQSDSYRNAKDMPPMDMLALMEAGDAVEKDYRENSRIARRSELARGFMMNAEGPGMDAMMDYMMRGGVSSMIIASRIFTTLYQEPEIPNPYIPKDVGPSARINSGSAEDARDRGGR